MLGVQIGGSVVQVAPIGRITVQLDPLFMYGGCLLPLQGLLFGALESRAAIEPAPMKLGLAVRNGEDDRHQNQ